MWEGSFKAFFSHFFLGQLKTIISEKLFSGFRRAGITQFNPDALKLPKESNSNGPAGLGTTTEGLLLIKTTLILSTFQSQVSALHLLRKSIYLSRERLVSQE